MSWQAVTIFAALSFVLLQSPAVFAQTSSPERIALWNGRAPIGEGRFEAADAWLSIYRPERPSGAAAIICPGGGYRGLDLEAEGADVAKWLTRNGIAGLVLEYRLPHGRPFVPLYDVQRAVRFTRLNAGRLGLHPSRIGIVGFSAGGHLAAMAGTHVKAGDPAAGDPIDRQSSRPDFLILVYPVITMGEGTHLGSRARLLGPEPAPALIDAFSAEKHVTAETPPTFLAHARNDRDVPPTNSRAFLRALQLAGVPSRYLELPRGGHGLNAHTGPMWQAWQDRSLEWLRSLGVISAGDAQLN